MSNHVPVVLVHGFMSTHHVLALLRGRLEREGFRVHYTDLSAFCLQDVDRLAHQLETTVERVCDAEDVEEVDIVGVSHGGVITMYYLRYLAGFEKVRRFVAVGAPVRGTWTALVGLPILGGWSKGIWQLLPLSQISRKVSEELPEDVEIHTISIKGDPICPTSRCQIEGASTNLILSGMFGPWKHQLVGFSQRVVAAIAHCLRGIH